MCSFTHDSAAALVTGGHLTGMAEEERLTGVKHTRDYPARSVAWLLSEAGLTAADVDVVAYNFAGHRYLAGKAGSAGYLLPSATRGRAVPRAVSFAVVHSRYRHRMRALRQVFPAAKVRGIAQGAAGHEDTVEMDWSALVGGLIGASIPAILAYLGLHRGRQSADAEAFGPAVLLLDHLNPDRVTMNINPDAAAEDAKWAELQRQLDVARERLLVVSAGNPRRHVRELAHAAETKVTNAFKASGWAVRDMYANRDNREWMDHARQTHAEAEAAMRNLIDANFSWNVLGRLPWARQQKRLPRPDTSKTIDQSGSS